MKFKKGDKIRIEAVVKKDVLHFEDNKLYYVSFPSEGAELEFTSEEPANAELIERPVTFTKEQVNEIKNALDANRRVEAGTVITNSNFPHGRNVPRESVLRQAEFENFLDDHTEDDV